MPLNLAMFKLFCAVLALFAITVPVCGEVLGGVCEQGGGNTTLTYHACSPTAAVLLESATFNLSVIPESATCGTPANSYCISHWPFGCLEYATCDSAVPANSHPKELAVDNDEATAWISNPSSDRNDFNVTLQLSFDKKYELSGSIVLVFQSGRPREMIIEKSVDHGTSWQPLQYYSQDCTKYSGVAGTSSDVTVNNPTVVICTGDYSAADPLSGGLVQFPDRQLLFLGPSFTDYQNLFTQLDQPALQSYFSFTDLRFSLIKPAIIGNADMVPQGDYYGISDIQISGRCSCNLHASSCSIVDGFTRCVCQHNTAGTDCEQCLPLYNNRPWMKGSYVPYPEGTANECQRCECYGHAQSCQYDSVYGAGICQNCEDNTKGFHCQECIDGFYHNESVPLSDPATCVPCDCEQLGVVVGSATCSQIAAGGNPIGQCQCKPMITGRRCDVCQDGFYGLLVGAQPDVCTPCGCNTMGTMSGSNTCDKVDGQCPCKASTDGQLCGQCKAGYHTFPLVASQECAACGCDWGGSVSDVCNADTGVCTCQNNVQGDKCSQLEAGSYFPFLDVNHLDPVSGACVLDVAMQRDLLHDGSGFARCQGSQVVGFTELTGQMRQPKIDWPYRLAVRYSHNSQLPWPAGILTVTVIANSGITNTSEYRSKQAEPINSLLCQQIGQTRQWTVNFLPGVANAWISPMGDEILLDVRCRYQISLTVGPKDPAEPNTEIIIDSVVPLPSLAPYPAYANADNGTKLQYDRCMDLSAALGTKAEYVQTPMCQSLTFSVSTQINLGANPCDCDPNGTIAGTQCTQFGGQCTCKPGVSGRRCDACSPGFYNFTDTGCIVCPESGCPVESTPAPTTLPVTTTTPSNGTTTPTIPGTDSSMIFVYIAIGVFLFLLFVFCMILAVILCRRCLAVRRLKREEEQQSDRINIVHGEHAYEQFSQNSDEDRSLGDNEGDKMSSASVHSLNLQIHNPDDEIDFGVTSSNKSSPKSSVKSETHPMMILRSSPDHKPGPNSKEQNLSESGNNARLVRKPSDGSDNEKRAASPSPISRGNGSRLSPQVRQPPDGMSSGLSDETKQNNSEGLRPAQPTTECKPKSSDSTPPSNIPSRIPSSRHNANTNLTRTAASHGSSPTPKSPQYSATPRSSSHQDPSESVLANGANHSSSQNPSIPGSVQNHNPIQKSAEPKRKPSGNSSIPKNPSPDGTASKTVPSQSPSQDKIAKRIMNGPPPQKVAHRNNSDHNSSANRPTASNGLSKEKPNPGTSAVRVLPANSTQGAKLPAASGSQQNPPSSGRRQKSPKQSRRINPMGDLDELNPRLLFTNNNPNLNYAGFGEFDEINGSLV